MIVDIPEVKADLEQTFRQYEMALVEGDTETLNSLFYPAGTTVRYGIRGDNQYGHEAIALARRNAGGAMGERQLDRTLITTFGKDFGVASTLSRQAKNPGKMARQQQTWIRTQSGWKIVAAHVSIIDEP
jgi:hypothetical protein